MLLGVSGNQRLFRLSLWYSSQSWGERLQEIVGEHPQRFIVRYSTTAEHVLYYTAIVQVSSAHNNISVWLELLAQ